VQEPAPDLLVWSKPLADGSRAVVLRNRSGLQTVITASWRALGLRAPRACAISGLTAPHTPYRDNVIHYTRGLEPPTSRLTVNSQTSGLNHAACGPWILVCGSGRGAPIPPRAPQNCEVLLVRRYSVTGATRDANRTQDR